MQVEEVILELISNYVKKIDEEVEIQQRQTRSLEPTNTLKMVKNSNSANSTTLGLMKISAVLKLKAIFSNYFHREARSVLRFHPSTIAHQATKRDVQLFSLVTMVTNISNSLQKSACHPLREGKSMAIYHISVQSCK
jgi:hypothetical protein